MAKDAESQAPDILVVDDEPDVARIISVYLESEGYRVRVASDGREALREVARQAPDCILLDIMMPVMDGWEVLKALKADGATAEIPVVVVTARRSDVDRIKGYSGGAVEYVTKPFDPETLVEYVARSLQSRPEKEKEELRRDRIKRLQVSTLYRITETLISTLELNEILDFISRELRELFGLGFCRIGLFEGEDSFLRLAPGLPARAGEEERTSTLRVTPRRLEETLGKDSGEVSGPRAIAADALVGGGEGDALATLGSLYLLPLRVKGKLTGAVLLGGEEDLDFGEEERELLAAIGNQAAMALENARLYDDLRYDEEVQRELLQRVITAQEGERRRLAAELHDGVVQNLVSALYRLRLCALRLPDSREDASRILREAEEIMDASIGEMRRIMAGLRPSVLDDLGLATALEKQARQAQEEAGLPISLELAEGGLPPLTPEAETAVFRIAQEALGNALRHSRGTRVSVSLRAEGESLVLEVTDDGVGFEPSEIRRRPARGFGIMGMRERAASLGGRLEIRSGEGRGTSIAAKFPFRAVTREV